MTVTIILIIIFLFFAIRGYRKGILGMIVGLFSLLFLIAFSAWLNPVVYNRLSQNEKISGKIRGDVSEQISKKEASSGITLPFFMDKTYQGIMNNTADIADRTENSIKDKVNSALTDTLSEFAIRGISIALTSIIAMIVIIVLNVIIRMIGKIPVLGTISRMLGLMAGIVEGLLLVSLILYILQCSGNTSLGVETAEIIGKNPLLSMFDKASIIAKIFTP